LQDKFHDTLRGRGKRATEWLDYVDETVYAV
jgi:hypothetical protein